MTTYAVGAIFNGEKVLEKKFGWIIRIADKTIADIQPRSENKELEEEDIVDLSDYSVVPGLIDAHIHVVMDGDPNEDRRNLSLVEPLALSGIRALSNSQQHLDNGVTTVRDLGAWKGVDGAVRNAIQSGMVKGPRMVVSGRGITTTGGHMDPRKYTGDRMPVDLVSSIGIIADSPWEARKAVREQLLLPADVIKLNATLSEHVRRYGGQCSPEMGLDMLTAICDEAHAAGRMVAAHCHGGIGVTWAIQAGVDTYEHGRFMTDEQLDIIAEKERFLVPTLSPEARRIDLDDAPSDPEVANWYSMATEAMYDTVLRASRAGVNIIAGTDAGMPHVYHGTVSYEMNQLAVAGLSNIDVLRSATSVAAKALGLGNEIGQIKEGHVADLIFVNGNPWDDPKILMERSNIVKVLQNGVEV